MPAPAYSREHMRRFATATAAYDRKHRRRTWMPDEAIVEALRGHAHCFASAHRIQVNLTADDFAFGLAAYRRARGQQRPKHVASAPLPLVSVQGSRRHHAA